MTTPLKAIVSDDGLTARPVNPYNRMEMGYAAPWNDFHIMNPSLPLSTPQQPGTEILVREVWQYEPLDEDYIEWVNCSESYYASINRHNESKNLWNGIRTRRIYEPIPLPEQDKGETKTTPLIKVNLKFGGGYQAVIDCDQHTVYFTKYNIITDVLDLMIEDIYAIQKAYEKHFNKNN